MPLNHELSNKQRIRFFLTSASAFAALFVLLGIIVFQLLQVSAYNQTDMSLSEMTTNRTLIEREISRLNQSDPFIDFPLDKPLPEGITPQEELFNTQIILWTENGEILNKEVLGGRYTQLNTLTLDATKLNEIIPVVLAESNLSFRSITIENSESLSSEVAYIQFLINTNQIDDSLTTFQWILFVCMFIFWLISATIFSL